MVALIIAKNYDNDLKMLEIGFICKEIIMKIHRSNILYRYMGNISPTQNSQDFEILMITCKRSSKLRNIKHFSRYL